MCYNEEKIVMEMFSMLGKKNLWRNRQLREHVAVLDGSIQPTLILTNGTYLNVFTKQWLQANIWLYQDRIIYVGDQLPTNQSEIEIVDCEGQFLVPGYIEPHAHPFQLYNPSELAFHAAKTGTTTLINDPIMWFFLTNRKKAFSLINKMASFPISMYWWARFDSQTAIQNEHAYFNTSDVLSWVMHHAVVQGGELTSWPRLLDGDDRLLYWMQETKRLGKRIEGHFPGASEKTLTTMKLLGVSGDHEAMTGSEVLQRLELGYQVGLRYSSIRPDLPKLISELLDLEITTFEQLTFTTDGSTPAFYEHGLINVCIDLAIKQGLPIEEAYLIGSYNAAKHFQLAEDLGSISPGKVAHINILSAKDNPHPISVIAKGEWIVKNEQAVAWPQMIKWEDYDIHPLTINWELTEEDLQFSSPIGLELVNDVIIHPYAVKIDHTKERLPDQLPEAFLVLIDRYGKWRVNTTIKGFTKKLGGIVSSYSPTGDMIIMGKCKRDMMIAWKRMKALGGGIVVVNNGKVLYELPLLIGGMMFEGPMSTLIKKEKELKQLFIDHGYPYQDPIFSIYFLSSTNLPYVRVTQKGIYDVLKRVTLFPANMR